MDIISVGSKCPEELATAARESSTFNECFDSCKPLSFHEECFVSLARAKCNGQTVVVKSWYKDKLDVLQRFQVDNECRIHSYLSHPTILPALLALETSRNIYLVVEHADGGDLRAHLQPHGLSERHVRDFIVTPLIQALTVLEKEGIVHRDLKPDNVLVQRGEVCLADFGLSMLWGPTPQQHQRSQPCHLGHRLMDRADSELESGLLLCDDTDSLYSSSFISASGPSSRSQSGSSIQSDGSAFGAAGALLAAGNAGGTPLYASPEVLLAMFKNQPPQHAISHKNDIWALGVMALEALTGSHPFAPASEYDGHHRAARHGHDQGGNLLYSIAHHTKINLPDCLSPEVADFLEVTLSRDPALRPTASELLKHPWLSRVYGASSTGGAVSCGHHSTRVEEAVECWEY